MQTNVGKMAEETSSVNLLTLNSAQGPSGEPQAGREATAPSHIKIMKVIQGGEEMPLNGGIVLPQDVHVKPFTFEIRLNTSLDARVFGALLGSNGLPRGHTDLNGRHPSLSDHLQGRILLTKVLPTFLSPKVVQDEATKNI
jgi:hypothetical protein